MARVQRTRTEPPAESGKKPTLRLVRSTSPAKPEPARKTASRVVRRTPTAQKPATKAPQSTPELPINFAPTTEERQAYEAEAAANRVDYAAVTARYVERIHNPMSAIRARCVQCCNGQMSEVRKCPATTCALHQFRMGANPFNKRTAERLAREAEDEDDE